MRKHLFAALILFFAGCQSSVGPVASGYRVESEISPIKDTKTFVIETHIYQSGVNGETELSAPRITVAEGQNATVNVVGSQSLTIDAMVARVGGAEEGTIDVAIADKGGSAMFRSEQKLVVPGPRG